MPLRPLADPDLLPALDPAFIRTQPAMGLGSLDPAPRILLLYGSLRERSFSRLATEEAARLLQLFGAETRIFDPSTLPLGRPSAARCRARAEEDDRCSDKADCRAD